jgi:nucleoside 2-deoxyribosyltransferase
MSKPIVYEDVMDDLAFLTDIEIGYLRAGDEPLRKMLTKRAAMFSSLHRAWTEFQPKENTFKRLNREEWKKKVYRQLNLTFKMTNEQAKTVCDLYWLRVDLPKGGIK